MEAPWSLEIVDGLTAGRIDETRTLLFEYMAATCGEVGWSVPSAPAALPRGLREEVTDPAAEYPFPGTFLLACRDGRVLGGVGLQARDNGSVEVKRLYVRPTARRSGVAQALMAALHRRARAAGFRRLVLDVLPSRTHVIAFYRSLGYTDTEPYADEPVPMAYLALDLRDGEPR